MATREKKGKRRTTSKPLRSKRPKPAGRPRVTRAKSKRPTRAAATASAGTATRRRAGRSAAAKPRSKPRFQQRRVVIRFKDGFDETRERKELTVRYGRIVLRPVFVVSRSAVARLQARAREQNPEYSLPDFSNYYFLFLQPGRKPADVARELLDRPTVGFAYEDAPTEPANPQPSTNKCSQSSRHFEGSGEGVNARSAWALPGGKGDGQFLVDVERGWTPEHTRLPTSRINLLVGKSLFGERAHGTSVLGIVCGQHTGGCEGIAPNVASVGLASTAPDANAPASAPRLRPDDAATAIKENVYDALAIGIYELVQRHNSASQNEYGVLLLEHQTDKGLPLETYEGIHALLKLATEEYSITVVEAAGNAGANLDIHPDAQILQQDSGAIVVGSAYKKVDPTPAPNHKRFHSSNFGSRVNCYAWGERVMCPAWLSGQPNTLGILDQCDDEFGHTSAAAAIIAGVALVVQGIVAHHHPPRPPLSASQLRAILSDAALGTPCGTGDQIGVMPDLGKIAPTL